MARPQQAKREKEPQPNLRGPELLDNPTMNKGTAFTPEERREYGLEGLLPHTVETIDKQLERVMEHLDAKPTDLERYIYLIGLSDRNETLFYRTLMADPARFVPIVYDPTVAEACLTFGHIYRRSRGMYITREMKGRIAEVMRNWPERDVRFICVSSGGRILGLGDIGANGMGIPIGNLQLYTACAAVPPDCLLPVLFDIGTTNGALRADPLYLGLREKPPAETELDELVKDFVKTIESLQPTILIGVSTKGGAFNQRVVETMSGLNERPIIFALSNPTDRAECTAEQAYTWSKGKALYAAGVQFPEVTMNGKTFHPGQANNFYSFPAIGLATYVARPRRITDEFFIVAAEASADQVGPILREKGMLFPSQANILETEVTTATRVAEFMFDKGLAQVERPRDIRAWIEGQLYKPEYSNYVEG